MLFVRNPTGISHSPKEFSETDDCVSGIESLAQVIRALTS
jgi:N-carbamoyl-L-amino-acid hydrolase